MSALNSIMNIFMPKDKIFFELFNQMAVNVTKMGSMLSKQMHEPQHEERIKIHNEIKDAEKDNDKLIHKIMVELGNNFITPFDREDIHSLATSMDDIADYVYASSKKMIFHNLSPDDNMRKLCIIIKDSCSEISQAVVLMKNFKNSSEILEHIVRVNSLENHCDDIYDMGIKELFEKEEDIKQLILRREIYSVMETVTDKCEDASNVIESVLIKYA